jgi:hypothetical protein
MAKKKLKKASPAKRVTKSRPSPSLDLSNPKDQAVLDVLALAMSADSLVTGDEIALAVSQMSKLLGLWKASAETTAQLRSKVTASVAACEKEGREQVQERALAQFQTLDERRMLFALAASMTCADGGVEAPEAEFLAKLRSGLRLNEAEGLRAMAGVAAVMARKGR